MADTNDSGRSFKRRDQLLEMEQEVRKWWDECQVFNAEANDQPPKEGEKFFGAFPFPYMNSYLHLGHVFSLSKLEFAAAYHRLRGTNVLLPFGIHCTGMPIKASADKLRREIERFGNPPSFPLETEETISTSIGSADETSVSRDGLTARSSWTRKYEFIMCFGGVGTKESTNPIVL